MRATPGGLLSSSLKLLQRVASCSVASPTCLQVSFDSSAATKSLPLCPEWVLDNDVMLRHTTGQKVKSIYDCQEFFCEETGILSVPKFKEASLQSSATGGDTIRVTFDRAGFDVTLSCDELCKYVARKQRLVGVQPLLNSSPIHRVDYSDFRSRESDAHFDAMVKLAVDGLIVVTGCGVGEESVLNLSRAIHREMDTLYGTHWHVQSNPQRGPKNNVAYTTVRLDLHHDLAYLESMPGLQLLHCQRLTPEVKGGESFFMDAVAVAEEVRRCHPASFKALCEIPCAFIKDDMDRPDPAQFYCAVPHFQLNDQGDVIKVLWAPAFEAPLPDVSRAAEYYRARTDFVNVMNRMRETHQVKFQLNEGECVIWQQARVLHAREAFEEPKPCSRVLHGTYVDIDSFRNRICVLLEQRGMQDKIAVPNMTNRSWR